MHVENFWQSLHVSDEYQLSVSKHFFRRYHCGFFVLFFSTCSKLFIPMQRTIIISEMDRGGCALVIYGEWQFTSKRLNSYLVSSSMQLPPALNHTSQQSDRLIRPTTHCLAIIYLLQPARPYTKKKRQLL